MLPIVAGFMTKKVLFVAIRYALVIGGIGGVALSIYMTGRKHGYQKMVRKINKKVVKRRKAAQELGKHYKDINAKRMLEGKPQAPKQKAKQLMEDIEQ